MDVLYVVREYATSGFSTLELRYSLRSLHKHLPHGRVVVAGFKPDWCVNVEHVPTVQRGTKWHNAYQNLRAGMDRMSGRFVLMNDDFFILRRFRSMPVFHREKWGPDRTARTSTYLKSKKNVRGLLARHGITDVTSYELHVPMVYEKGRLAEMFRIAEGVPVAGYQRTLYGNLYSVGGTEMADCKIGGNRVDWADWPFVSTNDRVFQGKAGVLLQEMFPDPSPYECDQ